MIKKILFWILFIPLVFLIIIFAAIASFGASIEKAGTKADDFLQKYEEWTFKNL
jgi:hypothetical protein